MRILAIDPALNRTGYAVIEIGQDGTMKYLLSDVIDVNKEKSLLSKLAIISNNISEIINEAKPKQIAIEETFVNKNPATSLKLGHARGAIITACLGYTEEIYEYTPTQIKSAVTGSGRADKEQVAAMVKILLPKAEFAYHDEADALAIAITHHHINSTRVKIAS